MPTLPALSAVVVVVVVLGAVSCGGRPAQPAALSSSWSAPALLNQVPAESPYLVAELAPVSEAIRQRILYGLDHRVAELLRLAEARQSTERAHEPWLRAILAVASELRGKDPASWWRELGFDPGGRFVLYGLSLWPVIRVEVANPPRLRRAIDHALTAAGISVAQSNLAGRAYWSVGSAEFTVVFAVLEREAVVAVLPTRALTTALPLVLGTAAPAHSLAAATTVPDLLSRHRLTGFAMGYIDSRNLANILAGAPAAGRNGPSELDAPIHNLTGPVPAICRADLDRLVGALPRLVFGYRRIDAERFDAVAVIEAAASVTAGLKRLRTAVPELAATRSDAPLFALGAAVNLEELQGWLRGVTEALRGHPFECPWLAEINRSAAQLASKLDQPLPPMLRGLRGFSLVVDDAMLSPPKVVGHLLVAGDMVADLVSMVAGMVPAIAGIPVKRDGQPVAISTQQLGIPIPSAHIAMTADRLVVASGPDSAREASEHLKSPLPASSPLFLMSADGPRLQKLLASLGQADNDNLELFGNSTMTLDVGDDGLVFDVQGRWGTPAAPAAPAAPPAPAAP
jgi:hypothetical protein